MMVVYKVGDMKQIVIKKLIMSSLCFGIVTTNLSDGSGSVFGFDHDNHGALGLKKYFRIMATCSRLKWKSSATRFFSAIHEILVGSQCSSISQKADFSASTAILFSSNALEFPYKFCMSAE